MRFNSLILIIFIIISSCKSDEGKQIAYDYKEVEVKFTKTADQNATSKYELTFFGDGNYLAKRVYKNGKEIESEGSIPNGKIIEKYENGSIKNEYFYMNGLREGKAIGYYQNGNIRIESTYKDGDPYGITKTFYEDGQMKSESKIIDGKKVYYKEYYKNGQTKEVVQYEDGVGLSKIYDESGNLIQH